MEVADYQYVDLQRGDMNRRIRDLRNLGLKTEQMLAEADVFGEDDLRGPGAGLSALQIPFRAKCFTHCPLRHRRRFEEL
jgi:hypothetical protein